MHPMSMTVAVGSNVTFNVGVSDDDVVLTYQWIKDDSNIPSATESTLQILGVDNMDEGVYSVLVDGSSFLFSSRSSQADLTVSKYIVSIGSIQAAF